MKAWALFALSACGFQAPIAQQDDTPIDGPPIVDPEGTPECITVPPAVHVDPMQWAASFRTAPAWNCDGAGETRIDSASGMVTNPCGAIDVTPSVAQMGNAANVMVVRLAELRVTNDHVVKLVGDKPIVFLVTGDVTVDTGGLIDAGAQGMTAGPGAATCTDNASGGGETSTTSGWGGGGGAFGTAGGQGGFNITNGGNPASERTLVPLRGGCAGASSMGSNVFGAGGGALAISAAGTISIGATAAANISSAGGGAPLFATGGGNGGGSGGGIHLAAPTITFGAMGAIRAHGGSGSSGDMASGTPGPNLAGRDGHATDDQRATDTSGQAGTQNNDRGRAGGLASIVNGNVTNMAGALGNAQSQGGRGGGGGGGGLIVTMTATGTSVCE
jgi:hypothetical protein